MALSYEEQRKANILANQALLESLGLASAPKPKAKPRPKPKAKAAPKPTRDENEAYTDTQDSSSSADDDDSQAPKRKRQRPPPPDDGRRRSGRATRQTRRFDPGAARSDGETEDEEGGAYNGPNRRKDEPMRCAQRLGVRTQNPKTFGHIPGVPIGTWWESRMDCSTAAVHGPPVAGIAGSAEKGAYSVALSGGYPDDVDLGEAFTYTGSGGRDLKGTAAAPKNLRTAPQTTDQTFDNNFNASLKKSADTRTPVRVIRGYKLDSKYAPVQGYRYDGLYVVERAYMAKGLTGGLLVCRYAFKRVPGQPALPERGEEEEEEGGEEEEVEEMEEGDGEEEEVEDEVEEEIKAPINAQSPHSESEVEVSGQVSRRTRSSTATPDPKRPRVGARNSAADLKPKPKPASRASTRTSTAALDLKPSTKRTRASLPLPLVGELPVPPAPLRRSRRSAVA